MSGQCIGYIRGSRRERNAGRQLEGVQLERVFTDKASGMDIKRPQLDERTTSGPLVQRSTKKGVRIEFIKEHLTFTGMIAPWRT
ncbi:transposon Tn21 resolvase [Arthrobacter sp. Hiyo6]|nr:transposon Tn21 resolvase [Arthrobacter sp. Hiyo6]